MSSASAIAFSIAFLSSFSSVFSASAIVVLVSSLFLESSAVFFLESVVLFFETDASVSLVLATATVVLVSDLADLRILSISDLSFIIFLESLLDSEDDVFEDLATTSFVKGF